MPPSILAAVWRGESGSTYPNPYKNSLGYGGLFGTKLWNGSTQAQANYAASIFHMALVRTGGNILEANGIYATGKPNAGIYGHAGIPTGVLPGYKAVVQRVKVDGKWYRVKDGHWVGKGPPGYHGASFLGEVGHYAIHPLAGAQKTVSAAKGPLDSALMRVIYAVVMVGGFLLLITGFAMIGLDLTLGRSSTAKKALEIAGVAGLAGKVRAGSQARQALRAPTDKELNREYRKGENQGTRAAARREGARVARSRIAKPENLKPQPKYSGKDDSGSVPF
jgi:hypothetical protein